MSTPERIIQVALPATLYTRIEESASQSGRSIESVLIEGLMQHFLEPSEQEEILKTFSDDQLWAVMERGLSDKERERMWALIEAGETHPLTDAENAELDALQDKADDLLVLRSIALALLSERGHDVSYYFNASK